MHDHAPTNESKFKPDRKHKFIIIKDSFGRMIFYRIGPRFSDCAGDVIWNRYHNAAIDWYMGRRRKR